MGLTRANRLYMENFLHHSVVSELGLATSSVCALWLHPSWQPSSMLIELLGSLKGAVGEFPVTSSVEVSPLHESDAFLLSSELMNTVC